MPKQKNALPPIGQRIRELRIAKGYSQGTLAQALRVSKNTVIGWEKGGGFKGDNLTKLASLLKVDPSLLLDPGQDPAAADDANPVVVYESLRSYLERHSEFRSITASDRASLASWRWHDGKDRGSDAFWDSLLSSSRLAESATSPDTPGPPRPKLRVASKPRDGARR